MSKVRQGKYFIIRTKINPALVLEVESDGQTDNVRVSREIQDWIGNNDHQLWFYSLSSKSLMNKKYNLQLDVVENDVIMKPLNSTRHECWTLDNGLIKAVKLDLVLEFSDGTRCTLAMENMENVLQHWKIENQPALFFYLKLKSDPSLVVDVKGDDKNPGAKVILYENKGKMSDNQLWYEDKRGFIRSKLNDFVMEVTDKNEVILNPYQYGFPKQEWVVSGEYIRNARDSMVVLHMKTGNVFLSHRLVAICGSPNDNLSKWVFDFFEHQSITLNHTGHGKNFVIRSMMTGSTLEVEERIIQAGNRVMLGHHHDDPNNILKQHFYQDKLTGTIRSILRNYVLEATDDGLKLSPFDPYNKMQMWKVDINKIRNKNNTSLVLQADRENKRVIVAQEDNCNDQLWEFCFMPARCFYIVSAMCDKVLDVRGCNASSGSSVILYTRNKPPSDNQLWYEDESGLLRSKLNGYVLDSSEDEVKVMPFDPKNKEQHWMITGDRIQNRYEDKMVIDISGVSTRSGASLIKYKFHGGENQRWKFEYVN